MRTLTLPHTCACMRSFPVSAHAHARAKTLTLPLYPTKFFRTTPEAPRALWLHAGTLPGEFCRLRVQWYQRDKLASARSQSLPGNMLKTFRPCRRPDTVTSHPMPCIHLMLHESQQYAWSRMRKVSCFPIPLERNPWKSFPWKRLKLFFGRSNRSPGLPKLRNKARS